MSYIIRDPEGITKVEVIKKYNNVWVVDVIGNPRFVHPNNIYPTERDALLVAISGCEVRAKRAVKEMESYSRVFLHLPKVKLED